MRVCLVGRFENQSDEGFKNVFNQIYKRLKSHCDIYPVNISNSINKVREIRAFGPDIIHQIAGPSPLAFPMLKFLVDVCKDKPISVMSALHSAHVNNSTYRMSVKYSAKIFSPDIMLAQSENSRAVFRNDIKVYFLPNGVDVDKFKPVSDSKKLDLRNKYGIDKDSFVVLHIGHLIRVRNLEILSKIQGNGCQVLIIGSPHAKADKNVVKTLTSRGCIIWQKYFENIEEIYQLADCYVFPVKKGHTLLMPLSVLEAMACNLPVISVNFNGLTHFFEPSDGLFLVQNDSDILRIVKEIKKGEIKVKTREKVLQYSWETVVCKLWRIYNEVLQK